MKKITPADKKEPIAAEGPISTREEEKQVEERVAIGANVIYEAIRREGDDELSRPAQALAWSALAAGLSVGFSFITEALLMAHLPDRPWRPLISRLGYSVGFLIVVLGRQQLFTENTLTAILPLLVRKNFGMFVKVARLWGVVLLGNIVGTYLFALGIAHSPIFDPSVRAALMAIGQANIGASFGTIFVRAIFAGWLIALMVWLLPAAETSHVAIIIILTYLIGLGGFSHVIEGSTTVFYLVAMKSASWSTYFMGFFLPALLGNILGGVSLVTALGHAQVVGGKAD
ncbi:MAG TPA: formate/nitrite transporter family protein [Candidatus Acidoferrales bacterium]|nr:formate/nitrite transporter family protein [Candidatus Acidoferrales bacterium]